MDHGDQPGGVGQGDAVGDQAAPHGRHADDAQQPRAGRTHDGTDRAGRLSWENWFAGDEVLSQFFPHNVGGGKNRAGGVWFLLG